MQEVTNTTICGQVFVPSAHAGRLLRVGKTLVALKMEKVIESMERTIRLQLKFTPLSTNFAIRTLVLIFCTIVSYLFPLQLESRFTRSFACSFSVISSCFSRICSSRNVGLSGLSIFRPGVPGTLMALFSGEAGVIGISTCCEGSFDEIYPKPTSEGCACAI